MDPDVAWTSPTDLADYAYCPRSHFYRHHPPVGATRGEADGRRAAGERYHGRVLSAERHRAERGSAYWIGLLVGVLLVLVGIAWFLYF